MLKFGFFEKIRGFIGREELIKETFVLAIATLIAAVLNYGFFFIVARFMSPETYGIFYTLISFTYIFIVIYETVRIVITRYTTKFNINQEKGKIKSLIFRASKKIFLIGGIGFLLFLLISPIIAGFLNIKIFYVILLGIFTFISIFIYLGRGILQGQQRFNGFGINILIESGLKFLLGLIFVLIGWEIAGIFGAFILATIATLTILAFQIKKILKTKIEKIETKEIYNYSVPILIGLVLITLMYTLDVILAKRFFSPEIAGYYAAISTLAKISFFCSVAVTRVMFPMVSAKHEKGEGHRKLLYKSLIIVLIISFIFLTVYITMPKPVVNIILGNQYNVDVMLGPNEYISFYHTIKYLAIAMMFLGLSYTLAFYKWSIGKKKFIIWICLALTLEIVLLYLFHKTILQYLWMMIIANAFLFVMMLFNLRKYDKSIKENTC